MKNLKTLRYAVIILIASILNSCTMNRDIRTVESPDKSVNLTFSDEGGTLKYQLLWQGEEMLNSSEISILPGKTVKIISASIRSQDDTWNPVWGQFSEIRNHYNELVFELEMEGSRAKLFTRAYDQGVSFRFELNEAIQGDSATLYCEYNLADKDELYCPAGEKEPLGPLAIHELKNNSPEIPRISLPVVVEKSNARFLSILESDLYAAEGFKQCN
jgi:hypothetical protein